MNKITPDWMEVVATKRLRQKAAIPDAWLLTNLPPNDVLDVTYFPDSSGLLSAQEIEITNTAIDALLAKLANGTWTSVSVTTAFSKRAVIAHQLTNCLTEIFTDRALARAAELDEHLKRTGKVVGPLHGLPCSLKDQINIKGLESTMGYVSWIGKYPERNAVIVDILESLGAVPFVKTNIPQTLMWPETFNLVFGRTTNPYNRSLTSGGSSGGEGALIALKGSPIGIGSDIGGSIRIPAAFCGLYGMRPSYGRIPYAHCVNSMEGQDSLPSVLGPLSGSLAGIKTVIQCVAAQKPWLQDPLALKQPWNEEEYKLVEHGSGGLLCFAILWNDGLVVPHPPVIRALETTMRALIATGHKVVDWKPLKHTEICETARQIWAAGSSEDYRVATSPTNEPLITSMGITAEKEKVADNLPFRPSSGDGTTAYKLWQIQKKRRDLREEYLEYWQATASVTGTGRPVDAIISPCASYTAPPHGMNRSANYTTIWNVLDYPALVIPVSKVDSVLDKKKPEHKFLSELDRDNYEFYDPSKFKNAPVSIQVVGRTSEDEALIAMSEIVDTALRFSNAQLWE